MIDDEDYGELSRWRWFAMISGRTWYAVRTDRTGEKQATIRMHNQIIGKPESPYEIDHVNGNGLDNRRSNLRVVTHRENSSNRTHVNKNSSSGITGVRQMHSRWQAYYYCDGEQVVIGSFDTPELAAQARESAIGRLGRMFVAIRKAPIVMRGAEFVARACSHTMAKRIAAALNKYTPGERGY